MKNLLCILVVLSFTGCEPGYRIYIRNNGSTNLYLKTRPSIESLFSKESRYYDSIIGHKIKQEGDIFLYRIKPSDSFHIWDNIGGKPTFNEIPFDYIEMISETDTLLLNNKEKIIEHLKREGKKYNYFIEMIK